MAVGSAQLIEGKYDDLRHVTLRYSVFPMSWQHMEKSVYSILLFVYRIAIAFSTKLPLRAYNNLSQRAFNIPFKIQLPIRLMKST